MLGKGERREEEEAIEEKERYSCALPIHETGEAAS